MHGTLPSQVAIVLSTRNGRDFLSEQLESFCMQSHVDWRLFWRDDDSDDETTSLMHGFAASQEAGRVVDFNDHAGRRGVTSSFMDLVRRLPGGQIVAFADQDDVWLPHKLERGVAALQAVRADRPALYCARQVLVDRELHPIRLSAKVADAPGFPQAMTQNIATGCTVMLNPAAAALLAASNPPPETLHDWWAYLLVTASGGQVIIDDEPVVLYRQHTHNAVGVPLSPAKRAVAAVRRGPNVFMRTFRAHMEALEQHHDVLSEPAKQSLARIGAGLRDGWGLRLRALALPGLHRQHWAETQLFRLWFLLG